MGSLDQLDKNLVKDALLIPGLNDSEFAKRRSIAQKFMWKKIGKRCYFILHECPKELAISLCDHNGVFVTSDKGELSFLSRKNIKPRVYFSNAEVLIPAIKYFLQ